MTPRQARFVQEYLVDLNATQAAIRAGYSGRTASSQGERLLRNAEVRREVAAAQQRRAERTEVRQDEILRELLRIALADPRQVFDEHGGLKPPHEWPEDLARAISGVDVIELPGAEGGLLKKVRFWPKVDALDKLMRHLGAYKDKLEHSGGVSVQLVDPYAKAKGD